MILFGKSVHLKNPNTLSPVSTQFKTVRFLDGLYASMCLGIVSDSCLCQSSVVCVSPVKENISVDTQAKRERDGGREIT